MAKPRGERVDGVLLLDKPGGMTSNRALQTARRLLDAARAGHTGTLDPMATGLLPLTFGEATKFAADLLAADKGYRATVTLGATTTTGDAEGEPVAIVPVDVTDGAIDAVLARQVGSVEQVPPMHSALKHEGRPLYALARAGIEVERAPRRVTIHRLQRIARSGAELTFDVDCSKGTYIRVLAEDIGRALGCGAHLSGLRRTRVGRLTLDHALTLSTLEQMPAGARREWLQPVDSLLASLPRIELDVSLAARFRLGQRLAVDAQPRAARVRVYAPENALLGTANVNEWGVVAPERLISSERVFEKERS
jgi:tRNA pseudouridine55 synthase